MKVQNKPDYLVFASDAQTGEVESFPNIARGWGVTIEQTESKPPMEWMNDAFNRIDKNILYLLQQGVPEWDSSVLYPVDAVIKYKSKLYIATVENDNAIPSTDTTKWAKVIADVQDGNITQKGIVQLSSAINSDSETTAATSKAVKTINDKVTPFINNFVMNYTWNETSVFSPGLLYRSVVRDDGVAGFYSKTSEQWTWMVNEKGALVIGSIPQSKIVYENKWQNMINNRKLGVTYQNTTGRPIFISVTVSNMNNGISWGTITATVDGVDIFSAGGGMNVGGIYKGATIAIPIMNGSYYNITSSTSGNINSWVELR